MERSRFTDGRIIAALKDAKAETSVPELCTTYGISDATFYKWRPQSGMDVLLMSRMKKLGDENCRPKKLYLNAQYDAIAVQPLLYPLLRATTTRHRSSYAQST